MEYSSNDGIRSKDLMLMLGLNESVDQLTMATREHWNSHVLRKDDTE